MVSGVTQIRGLDDLHMPVSVRPRGKSKFAGREFGLVSIGNDKQKGRNGSRVKNRAVTCLSPSVSSRVTNKVASCLTPSSLIKPNCPPGSPFLIPPRWPVLPAPVACHAFPLLSPFPEKLVQRALVLPRTLA